MNPLTIEANKMSNQDVLEFIKKGTVLSKDKDHLLIGWGERNWSQCEVKAEAPNFYFPDFFLKIGMPWFTHEHWMHISIAEFEKLFSKENLPGIEWKIPENSLTIFESKFNELKSKFKRQELKKAVPYIFEETDTKMSSERLTNSLSYVLDYIRQYPAFIYGLWGDEEGFLGATPELLFDQTDSKKLKTVACAGTFNSNIKELSIDSKLFFEHEIVVDGITESLKSFGTIDLKPQEKLKLSKLTHLVTPIEVELHEPLDFKKMAHVLHPTPALGAFPKDKGMFFLEHYQMSIPRGRFGAIAGFSFKDSARCLVAIRNVQWDKKGMKLGAGVGVVMDSSLQDELLEIRLKLDAIRELLRL